RRSPRDNRAESAKLSPLTPDDSHPRKHAAPCRSGTRESSGVNASSEQRTEFSRIRYASVNNPGSASIFKPSSHAPSIHERQHKQDRRAADERPATKGCWVSLPMARDIAAGIRPMIARTEVGTTGRKLPRRRPAAIRQGLRSFRIDARTE